jgi:hypothetical protein
MDMGTNSTPRQNGATEVQHIFINIFYTLATTDRALGLYQDGLAREAAANAQWVGGLGKPCVPPPGRREGEGLACRNSGAGAKEPSSGLLTAKPQTFTARQAAADSAATARIDALAAELARALGRDDAIFHL